MNTKNEVFEYPIDQLRQQLPVVDVMGEIKRWSIDRSIAGRGNYTVEENAIIDAYIGLEHNPCKQQCEYLAHEVQSLKNQLRDASAQIRDLHVALVKATGGVEDYKLIREQEQSGCRKEDAQECEHDWVRDIDEEYFECRRCGVAKSGECEHDWEYYYPNGRRCTKCGRVNL